MSTLRLEANYEAARAIGPWLQKALDDPSPLRERIGELELAIHEVAINVVDHAFGPTDAADDVDVADVADRHYTISLDDGSAPDEVIVQLRDSGAAFAGAETPNLDEPQVGGYGLFIAERLTSSLAYERVDGTNIWTLTFAASGTPHPQETTP